MIGFGEAVRLFYKNYVNFEGRATRAEYWWPVLMQLVIYTALAIAIIAVIGTDDLETSDSAAILALGMFGAGALFALVNILPSISVKIRRFHDLDQTGWLVLLFWVVNIFIPVAELARMLWFAFRGTEGNNQYGPDPHGYDGDIFG